MTRLNELHIMYTASGTAVSDRLTEKYLMDACSQAILEGLKVKAISVSTENIISMARVLYRQKKLPADSLVFQYEGQWIKCNERGRLPHWPQGFGDHYDRCLDVLCED